MSVPGKLAQDAVNNIIFDIENDLAKSMRRAGICQIDVASHLHIADRTEAYHLLRKRLRIRNLPELTRSVKGIDGRAYVESLYASNEDGALAIIEAREVMRKSSLQFSQAYVLIAPRHAFAYKVGLLGGKRRLRPTRVLTDYIDHEVRWSKPFDQNPSPVGNMSQEFADTFAPWQQLAKEESAERKRGKRGVGHTTRLTGRRLDPIAITALVGAAVLAVIFTILVVILVAKQRATVGNPAYGPSGTNQPYEFLGLVLGVVGFAVIMTILEAWVIGSRDDFNYWVVIVPTIILAIVLAIVIAKFGKNAPPSSPYGMSAQPSVHLPRMHL